MIKANNRIYMIERYADKLNKVVQLHVHLYEIYVHVFLWIALSIKKVIVWFMKGYIWVVIGLSLGHLKLNKAYKKCMKLIEDFARITTTPFNYAYFFYLTVLKYIQSDPIEHHGVHYITALMGGGKSSSAYDVVEKIRRTTGKGAYINVSMEKPRYDQLNNKWFKYHPEFDIEEFWGVNNYTDDEGKEQQRIEQLKAFDLEFDNLILDEWLSKMNHRQNNTKLYKEVFIAFIAAIAHMRHQHMKRIYVLSQLDTTDIQLMAMFKYIHEVEVVLNVPYSEWVRTGSLDKHIVGWWFWTYKYKRNRKKSSTDKVLYKKYFRPCTANLEYFESMNQAHIYESLPKHKIDYTKGRAQSC